VVAFEAAAGVFPGGRYDPLRGGRKLFVLAGPRIGWRAASLGIFGKARAGVARIGEGRARGACIQVFPPPEGCFEAEVRLALDLGAVAEFYPSSRLVLRIDVGDLVQRLGSSGNSFAGGGGFTNSFIVSAGAGVRF